MSKPTDPWTASKMKERNAPHEGRVRAYLDRVIADKPRHALFMNMLSMLEHMGSRKIMLSQMNRVLTEDSLKHLAEEARHAYYFKRQAERANGGPMDGYLNENMTSRIPALMYFGRMDAGISKKVGDDAAYGWVKAEDGMLSMATTDMDLELNESVAANVSAPGTTTAPAHTFHDIVRKLPDGSDVEIELNAEGTQMTVRAGRSQFKLSCLPVADFPELGTGELPTSFALPAADLRALIDRTKFAMSTEETRYYLNGIYVHEADSDGVKVLRAVATDGHRLARFEMPMPEGVAGMPGVIIPRKAVVYQRFLMGNHVLLKLH